jgi:hypothetical protein
MRLSMLKEEKAADPDAEPAVLGRGEDDEDAPPAIC